MIARVNDSTFTIEWKGGNLYIDDAAVSFDRIETGPGTWHILSNGKSYQIQFLEINRDSKTIRLNINGRTCHVELRSQLDQVLERLGMQAGTSHKLNAIKAPMPGLIVSVSVKEGNLVKSGDTVLILEAMKMENVIRATGEGTVKKILARKGDRVEKGQTLVEF